ncbi:hypothetical protein OKW24_005104 [Peribacillus simplex]|uniref:hypothetical protein n=1 Tax=Peribacillus simplex TaxID=1478 RepID=UPI0024E1DE76|nr:hypothetical protein [Peribacillus simplex]MDF9763331.1 hypothetical protein [Peribacillus simplex]
MVLNQLTKGKIKPMLGPRLAPFSKIAIGICVTLNSAKVAPQLSHIDAKLIKMGIMVFFYSGAYYPGWQVNS